MQLTKADFGFIIKTILILIRRGSNLFHDSFFMLDFPGLADKECKPHAPTNVFNWKSCTHFAEELNI